MKKKLFCVWLVLGFFAFALAPLAVQAQEKTMKLRLSVMWPPQHPWTKTFDQWGKDIAGSDLPVRAKFGVCLGSRRGVSVRVPLECFWDLCAGRGVLSLS